MLQHAQWEAGVIRLPLYDKGVMLLTELISHPWFTGAMVMTIAKSVWIFTNVNQKNNLENSG